MQTSSEKIYIVDYDIPVEKRKTFYKKIKSILGANLSKVTSTKSVVMTSDYKKAITIHKLATTIGGQSNIYIAYRITEQIQT